MLIFLKQLQNQKYLSFRKDFILKNKNNSSKNPKKNISKKNKNEDNDINLNSLKTKVKSTSRKYYEKYDNSNIVSPVTLGFNGLLVVYPAKAGEKERLEKELNEEIRKKMFILKIKIIKQK